MVALNCAQLGFDHGKMDIIKVFHRFQVNNDLLFDKQIYAVLAHVFAVEKNINFALLFNCQAALVQGNNQRILVDGFNEAGTESAMDFDCRANDLSGELFVFQSRSLIPGFLPSGFH